MGVITIWDTDMSEVEKLEWAIPSIVTRREVRKRMGRVRNPESLVELLKEAFPSTTNALFEKCKGLLERVIRNEIVITSPKDPISHCLGDIISRKKYPLIRGVLADFIYRAATLLDPGIEDKTGVPWIDAKGFQVLDYSEPIGVIWPVIKGRELQKKGKDPVWFDLKREGRVRLYQLVPPGVAPVLFCGRPYPWIIRVD